MFKCILICLMAAFAMVLADQIYIYSPPSNGVYHPTDVMDIRYHVRSVGMTKIWETSAKLVHDPSKKTINSFPSVNWNTTNDDNVMHGTWIIPAGLDNGNYTLSIDGNVTRLCSKNNDGAAPFTHCKSTVSEIRTFVINNGTLA